MCLYSLIHLILLCYWGDFNLIGNIIVAASLQ